MSGKPVKLGIQWQSDEADPKVIVISDIIESSPAALAELKINDRIYEIDGEKIENSEEFRKLVRSRKLPFSLLVERKGRLKKIDIQSVR